METKLQKRFELEYSKVLAAIFELVLDAGIPSKTLANACAVSLRNVENKTRLGGRDENDDFITAGLVLSAWHRDRRYLNKQAAPKAIPLLGPVPSVEALVRSERARKNAAIIACRLKTLQLVISKGRNRYMPTSDVAVISAAHPLVAQHAARALSTLLETVGRNMHYARRLGPLIERVAEVPDLPQEHIRAFEKFTQIQGRNFIRTVNDWLESRRAKGARSKRSAPTVRAGVHTYAYVAAPRQKAARAPRT